jgi:predicted nucleic acid-binding protein
MAYLVDSNILVRVLHRSDPDNGLIRAALGTLWRRGEKLCFTSQNLGEFWNVCTRPATARGGYGLTIAETDRRARLIERFYTLLPDTASYHGEWRRLLVTYTVQGVAVHDARLVAAMKVHGITHILTLDTKDFARYTEITAVHPQHI